MSLSILCRFTFVLWVGQPCRGYHFGSRNLLNTGRPLYACVMVVLAYNYVTILPSNVANLAWCTVAIVDSADLTSLSPGVLLEEIPFTIPERSRLRNDQKRRRRRTPEGVAHSTSLTPIDSSRTPPAHLRWRYIFGTRIPSSRKVVTFRGGTTEGLAESLTASASRSLGNR